MTREEVKAGLRSWRRIDGIIEGRRTIAAETGPGDAAAWCLAEAEQLTAAKREMLDALNRLEPLQRDVIWRQYIRGEYWVRIAQKHHYSERQIFRVGEQGLDALGEILEEYPAAAEFCRERSKGAH